MKRPIFQFFSAAALTGFLFVGGAFAQSPSILSMNPTERTAGAAGNFTLTLSGAIFCPDAGGGSTISFNTPHTAVTPSGNSSSTVIAASEVATAGTVNVTLTTNVSAGCPLGGGQTSNVATFTINPPLALDPAPLRKATLNYPYFQPLVVNGGTAPFLFSIAGALPPGLNLDPVQGIVSGTTSTAGSFPIVVTVVDSGGGQTNMPYTIGTGQAALVPQQGTPQSVLVNSPFPTSFVMLLLDANGSFIPQSPVTFTAPATGPGGSFAGSGATATDDGGVATAPLFTANTVAGSYSVTGSAPGTSLTAVFNLTNTPGAPSNIGATAGTPQSTPVNTAFPVSLQATVRDSFGNPVPGTTVLFSPGGAAASGAFAGSANVTTNASGVATAPVLTANSVLGSFTVTATFPGANIPASFSLTNISAGPANITPTGGTPQSVQIGFSFPARLQARVTDAGNNPFPNATVTFSLPASGASGVFQTGGATATAQTNASGVATSPLLTANGIEGSYNASATVAGVAATASFSLTNTSGPSITTGQLPVAIVGSPYNAGVEASGGMGGYVFSIVSGALPQGLTLNSSGAITGTPLAAGSFPILVQVTDSIQATAARELTLRVVAALAITSSSPLPSAFLGQNYSQTFGATGGQPGYTWSISGTTPPGLSFNGSTGVLSGTPTALGDYSFTVQVTDFAQRTVTKSFTLTSAAASSAPGIQISANSLTFDAPAGGGPPPPQYVSLVSSNQQPLTVTVTVDSGTPGSPAPPWLSTRVESAITPARLAIVTDQAALPAGSYNARVVVTYPGAQPQVINIAFSIRVAAPQLTVSPGFLRFVANFGSPNSAEQNLLIGNSGGGGAIDFTVSVVSRSPWLTVTPLSGRTSNTGGMPLRVIANSQGLRIGSYFDKIRIQSTTGGTVDVPVSLFVSPNGAIIGVNPVGIRFDAREGNGLTNPRDVSILNLGSGTVNWKAELMPGPLVAQACPTCTYEWLTLSSSTGQATPNASSKLTLTADPRSLPVGSFYRLIRFTDPQALNSPQYAVAVLKVAAATAAPEADLTPAGLYFTAAEGGSNPPSQTLRIFVNKDTATAFQAAASTDDRAPWISIDRPSGSASTQSPGQIVVSINTAGLRAGVYSGEISVSLSTTKIRSANVTLVVLPQGATLAGSDKQRSATSCTPAKLAVTSSSLANAFASPAGWPTPLLVRLTDDCSNPAVNAHVVATFSNGDPPLALSLTDPAGALYSGTWAPGKVTSQMTVTLIGLSQGLTSASARLTGTIDANPAPALNPNGIANNLNPSSAGAALAPGTIAQIYGGSLAPSTGEPGTVPLPTTVNDTTVLIGLVQAPLYFVSDGQVNAQIPTELQPDRQYSVLVSSGAAFTLPDTITTASVSPGLTAFAQHSDYSRIAAESPIRPGESIILYLVGMGATDQTVASGAASPGNPPALVNTRPIVSIGGKQGTVDFAGLSPGAVGLYQINVQTPADLASGDASVTVTQGDVSSNTVTLPVR